MAAVSVDRHMELQRNILVAKRKRNAAQKLLDEAASFQRQADEHENKAKKIKENITWQPSERNPNESRMDSVKRRVKATTTFNHLRLTFGKICHELHSEVEVLRNSNSILKACASISFPIGSTGYPLCRFFNTKGMKFKNYVKTNLKQNQKYEHSTILKKSQYFQMGAIKKILYIMTHGKGFFIATTA